MKPTIVLSALVLALLTACGSPAQDTTTAPAPTSTGVRTVAASNNVTGLPYPASCVVGSADGKVLPDPTCTPGAVTTGVTPDNIKTTICAKGWTSTVRAPEAQTETLKHAAMAAYEVKGPLSTVELDHLVPLELGGSNDVANLWPESSDLPGHGFRNTKDTVEHALNRAVCAGTTTLSAAQNAIASNWATALATLNVPATAAHRTRSHG